MKRPRGQCSACRYRYRLRRDGTVQPHLLYSGSEAHECEGSGKAPRPFDPAECGRCMAYAADQPHLVGAAASIGISYGKSTGQVLRGHLTYFHEHGHDLAATGMYEDRGGASS